MWSERATGSFCLIQSWHLPRKAVRVSYYRSNAVYEQLASEQHPMFVWLTGNSWALVYGDSSGAARVAVLATGTSCTLSDRVRGAFVNLFKRLSLPAFELRFDDQAEEISEVHMSETVGEPLYTATLLDLTERFRNCGLPVAEGRAGKAVNAHTSSAFHNWQRMSLGSGISVSDLDLLRLDVAGQTIEAIELKRSYIPLNRWTPYRQDYINFVLLCSALSPSGIPLTIAYNRRTKNPIVDDPSVLSLFNFKPPELVHRFGTFTFSEFVRGTYMTTGSPEA